VRRGSVVAVLACCLAVGWSAMAQNLKERKEIERGQKALDQTLEKANKKCETKLKVTVDVKSFLGNIDKQHNFASPHSWCGSILDGMRRLCGDADGKKSIQTKVGEVACHYDANATKEKLKRYGPIFILKNKKLSAGYNLATSNIEEETKKFLENNL
jgi:hypothetical protein